jgi:polyvinyl alcohol dehydrogenase (cytochrome)
MHHATSNGTVHAIDAKTGAALWRTRMDDHPFTVVTGAPQFKNGKLYVPVSSVELGLAMSPFYGCCKFRGSMTRLDPATGSIQWRTYTIEEEAHKTDKHYFFVQHWGPSGAPIWSAPTVNEELGLVYSGTGENYTAPATLTSDAILAFDSEDGSLRWSRQFTSDDTFNMACNISFKHPNCPAAAGPDFDFGAPPILAQTTTGKPILLAGQKSGGVYGMNPATGELVWQQQFGRGGYLGGVHWGMAVHEDLGMLYVPISDVPAGAGEAEPEPGLHAIDIASGERRWSVQRDGNCEGRDACRTGFSAAILATEDLVFVGALDGQLYGIDTANGDILWEYDSWRDYDSVNELPTQGGAIDVHGPFVAGRQLIVQSGYGSFGQRGGNALLVFELNED